MKAKFNNYKSNKKIVLNYPGEKIQVDLVSLGNNILNLKIHITIHTISIT